VSCVAWLARLPCVYLCSPKRSRATVGLALGLDCPVPCIGAAARAAARWECVHRARLPGDPEGGFNIEYER